MSKQSELHALEPCGTRRPKGLVKRLGWVLLIGAFTLVTRTSLGQQVVCGDNLCSFSEGESCQSCAADCGACTTTLPSAVLTSPVEGAAFTASACPSSECSASVPHHVNIDAAAPVESVQVEYFRDGSLWLSVYVCRPNPSFESIETACPAPGAPFDFPLDFGASGPPGDWTTKLTVTDVQGHVSTPVEVHYTVLPSTQVSPGPMKPRRVTPLYGSPALLIRENPEQRRAGERIRISGENLNRGYLQAYFSPVRGFDPQFDPSGGLPTASWCQYEAEVLGTGVESGVSFVEVRVPEIPERTRYNCEPGKDETVRSEDTDWRIVVRDPWIRAERTHEWEAVPDPYQAQGQREPYFRLGVRDYTRVHGFSFCNKKSSPNYEQFLSVYGENAYLCVGALGACVTRIPDPLYGVYYWIFKAILEDINGTCAGMSSTSQLMARGDLQPSAFERDVHYAFGLSRPGEDVWAHSSTAEEFTGPARPASLWAEIMRNHGVQTSAEFLYHVLNQVRDGFSLDTSPRERLAALRGSPRSFVLCGDKHCVTPHAVENDRILVYDNSNPDKDCYIDVDVQNDTYTWSDCRPDAVSLHDLYTIPLDVWRRPRTMPGIGTVLNALYSLTTGAVNPLYRDGEGNQIGWSSDGAFVDGFPGAKLATLFSAEDGSGPVPVALPLSTKSIEIQTAAHGDSYGIYLAGGGRLFSLEFPDARAEDQDTLHILSGESGPESVTFVPERRDVSVVAQVGMVHGDRERSVFTVSELTVGSGEVEVRALVGERGIQVRNGTDASTEYSLLVETADGESGSTHVENFGSVAIASGATQRVTIADWPQGARLDWWEDRDGDGTADETGTLGEGSGAGGALDGALEPPGGAGGADANGPDQPRAGSSEAGEGGASGATDSQDGGPQRQEDNGCSCHQVGRGPLPSDAPLAVTLLALLALMAASARRTTRATR